MTTLSLGIKSDPVEYRYSYEWLFRLMKDLQITYLQLGSSFEFYQVEDSYFQDLRDQAAAAGVEIRSCFTAHRELGGFFTGDPRLESAARRSYERWIQVAALLGADHVGSNPGAIYRDRAASRDRGIAVFLQHLTELQEFAYGLGIRALTMEPMSSRFEPPSTPEELDHFVDVTARYHEEHPSSTVPVFFCGDISHALVTAEGKVEYDHWELFEQQIPKMAEFHFKNTDSIYGSTFGFEPANEAKGIIDLSELRQIMERRSDDFPVSKIVGYLEIGGPKLGRDYSDPHLREQLVESVRTIRKHFPEA